MYLLECRKSVCLSWLPRLPWLGNSISRPQRFRHLMYEKALITQGFVLSGGRKAAQSIEDFSVSGILLNDFEQPRGAHPSSHTH